MKQRRRWPWIVGIAGILAVLPIGVAVSTDEPDLSQKAAASTDSSDATDSIDKPAKATEPVAERPVSKPSTYRGVGDKILRISKPDRFGIGYAKIRHYGMTNFAVQTIEDKAPELLVNEIGSYSGTVAFDLDGMHANRLRIIADGGWSVKLLPIERLRWQDNGERITGHGDDVFVYGGDDAVAAVTYKGDANFTVTRYGGGGSKRLIDKVGPYAGKKLIPANSLIVVSADGNWSFRPRRG